MFTLVCLLGEGYGDWAWAFGEACVVVVRSFGQLSKLLTT